jgi:hypothetical protein
VQLCRPTPITLPLIVALGVTPAVTPAVVVIGVDRRRVGGDNSVRRRTYSRERVITNLALSVFRGSRSRCTPKEADSVAASLNLEALVHGLQRDSLHHYEVVGGIHAEGIVVEFSPELECVFARVQPLGQVHPNSIGCRWPCPYR